MTDLTIFPADIAQLSVSQLAALPATQKLEITRHLDEAIDWLTQMRTKFDAALTQCYGDQLRAARQKCSNDSGQIHLQDGSVRVSVDHPLCVRWDQTQLAAIAQRITSAGEPVEDYLDITYSVAEELFNNWPPSLRAQFAPARSIQLGQPIFQLRLVEEE